MHIEKLSCRDAIKAATKQPVEDPIQCLVGCLKETTACRLTYDFIKLNTQHVKRFLVSAQPHHSKCEAMMFKTGQDAALCLGQQQMNELGSGLLF